MPCIHTPWTDPYSNQYFGSFWYFWHFLLYVTLTCHACLLTYGYLQIWVDHCIESFLSSPQTKIVQILTGYHPWPIGTWFFPCPYERFLHDWHQNWHWFLHFVPEVLVLDSWSSRQETAMGKGFLRNPTVSGSGWSEFSTLVVVFPSLFFDSVHVQMISPALPGNVLHENFL